MCMTVSLVTVVTKIKVLKYEKNHVERGNVYNIYLKCFFSLMLVKTQAHKMGTVYQAE